VLVLVVVVVVVVVLLVVVVLERSPLHAQDTYTHRTKQLLNNTILLREGIYRVFLK